MVRWSELNWIEHDLTYVTILQTIHYFQYFLLHIQHWVDRVNQTLVCKGVFVWPTEEHMIVCVLQDLPDLIVMVSKEFENVRYLLFVFSYLLLNHFNNDNLGQLTNLFLAKEKFIQARKVNFLFNQQKNSSTSRQICRVYSL